jgi:hypothetical protein
MAFLSLDGKSLLTFGDSLTEEPIDIGGSVTRGINGAPLVTRTRQLRRWTFRMPAMTYADSLMYTAWIEGYGLRVPVLRGGNVSEYASTGVADNSAGTQTFAATGGAHSGASALLTIGSGSQWGFRPTNRMQSRKSHAAGGYRAGASGITIMGWREWTGSGAAVNEGVGATAFRHTIASLAAGSTEFARGASADPTGLSQYVDGAVSAAANMGNIIGIQSTTSPHVSLHGKRNDSTSEAVKWSDVIVVPFAIPSTWVTELYTYAQSYEMGDLPFRWLTGDVVGTERVCVRGSVMRSVQLNATPRGTSANNNNMRVLEVELLEAPRYTATP